MTDTPQAAPAPELSRIVDVAELDGKGVEISIEATAEEGAALAGRFRIIAIDVLKGSATLRPAEQGDVVMHGHVQAVVKQTCVISQEPVREEIDEAFEIRFSPHAHEMDLPDLGDTREIDPALLDLPEPLVDGQIDVGEVMAQEVALSLTPYPRKQGAELTHPAVITQEEAQRSPNPFAGLAGLKDKLARKNEA